MIISFVFLLILNLFIIFYIDELAKLINIYDKPDNKLKLHKKKTPILGGFILVINFSIIFILQILKHTMLSRLIINQMTKIILFMEYQE